MNQQSAARRQLVTFEVADQRFAADIFAVERVLRYEAPRLIPNAAAWLKGIIAHGGAAIPVVDLRERLGLDARPPTERSRILVVVVQEERIGVIVDAVLAVLTVEATEIEAPPPIYRGLAKEYLEGIVQRDEQLFVVLAASRLLSTTERIEMEQVMSKETHDGR